MKKNFYILLFFVIQPFTMLAQEQTTPIDISVFVPSVQECWIENDVDVLHFMVIDKQSETIIFHVKEPEKSEVERILQGDIPISMKTSIVNNYIINILNIINEYSEDADDEWTFYSEDRIQNIEKAYIDENNKKNLENILKGKYGNKEYNAQDKERIAIEKPIKSANKIKILIEQLSQVSLDKIEKAITNIIGLIIGLWLVKVMFKAFIGGSKSKDENDDWLDGAWFHDHKQKM